MLAVFRARDHGTAGARRDSMKPAAAPQSPFEREAKAAGRTGRVGRMVEATIVCSILISGAVAWLAVLLCCALLFAWLVRHYPAALLSVAAITVIVIAAVTGLKAHSTIPRRRKAGG